MADSCQQQSSFADNKQSRPACRPAAYLGARTMNIAIIGTGNVGGALGTSLARAGHDVTFSRSGCREGVACRERGRRIRGRRGRGGSALPMSSCIAVPFGAVASVAAEIAPVIASKVVIDTTNPLKADYSGLATGDGPSGAELPSRPPCRVRRSSRPSTRCSPATRQIRRPPAPRSMPCTRPMTTPPAPRSPRSPHRSGSAPCTSDRSRQLESSSRWPGSTSASS